jgi:hypothetical protein
VRASVRYNVCDVACTRTHTHSPALCDEDVLRLHVEMHEVVSVTGGVVSVCSVHTSQRKVHRHTNAYNSTHSKSAHMCASALAICLNRSHSASASKRMPCGRRGVRSHTSACSGAHAYASVYANALMHNMHTHAHTRTHRSPRAVRHCHRHSTRTVCKDVRLLSTRCSSCWRGRGQRALRRCQAQTYNAHTTQCATITRTQYRMTLGCAGNAARTHTHS